MPLELLCPLTQNSTWPLRALVELYNQWIGVRVTEFLPLTSCTLRNKAHENWDNEHPAPCGDAWKLNRLFLTFQLNKSFFASAVLWPVGGTKFSLKKIYLSHHSATAWAYHLRAPWGLVPLASWMSSLDLLEADYITRSVQLIFAHLSASCCAAASFCTWPCPEYEFCSFANQKYYRWNLLIKSISLKNKFLKNEDLKSQYLPFLAHLFWDSPFKRLCPVH
jgi:hypothetical protein